ncbi:sensor histidine kinase [Leadbettera azotonutricia]|uniref:histidine kinase n=1 Tax=Leadbettera azotonutricia (strain ATCC BAA-888 / DSM 13862 / ZAS-9) TaxID=545695 RepID=F5Y804_LEAAZ|nr:ATP-binding protein [Leadbettera azotonutricia]AEF82024.1 multi-sensor signal transduction histidine kinase [Leadbettera azotonutricia ZAS-9]
MKRIIFIFTCVLSGLSIVFTAFFIHLVIYWEFSEDMKKNAAMGLEYARAGLELSGITYLETLKSSDPRFTLVDKNGTVLFDNTQDAASMDNHLNRPEIQTAINSGGIGEITRYSNTIGKQTYYRAIRLKDGNILRIAVTTDSIMSSGLKILPYTLLIAILAFSISLISAAKITKRIVDPINKFNLEYPENNTIYEELSPFLYRIKKQNDTITDKMNELKKRQLEFQAITGNMGEGLLILDREGHILSENKSALNLLGVHSNQQNQNLNVFHLRRDEPFRKAIESCLEGNPSETLLETGDRHIRLLANPVRENDSPANPIQGAVIMLLDITEIVDREKLRREFSANVSHELKTPLTVISGYGEIISNGLAKPEDCRGFGAQIYKEAQRLLNLINDIMELSRLDEGGSGLKREKIDLFNIALTGIERITPAARMKNIKIGIEGESIEIEGIPKVLEEMIFNLLDNGIKYNKENGAVIVKTAIENGHNFPQGKTALLSVSDTGIGIAPDEQERIFERFYRGDKSRNSAGGTGLGLSIVKHGALLHKAKIAVESSQKGTIITLRFPMQ